MFNCSHGLMYCVTLASQLIPLLNQEHVYIYESIIGLFAQVRVQDTAKLTTRSQNAIPIKPLGVATKGHPSCPSNFFSNLPLMTVGDSDTMSDSAFSVRLCDSEVGDDVSFDVTESIEHTDEQGEFFCVGALHL